MQTENGFGNLSFLLWGFLKAPALALFVVIICMKPVCSE